MAGVEYSIFFSSSASGLQTVNLLKAPTTLVGAIFSGQYLGIVIDPANPSKYISAAVSRVV